GAAFERRTVDPAVEIDDDTVAPLDLAALALGGERPVLFGNLADRLIDLGVGDLGDRTLELDPLEIAELDLRQDLERELAGWVGGVGLSAGALLDLRLLVRDRPLGLHGEFEPTVAHDLGFELADHRLDGLRHHRLAVDLLQVGDGHLARTESTQLNAVLEL